MDINVTKKDWFFLLFCLVIGIVGEEAFFRDQIGISYFVFIAAFYMLVFWRFRTFAFTHQRLGYLVLIAIWVLAAGYYLYDSLLFYVLNIVAIPSLVLFHLALITSPKKLEWTNVFFVFYILRRLFEGLRYNALFTRYIAIHSRKNNDPKHNEVWKKILLGVVISVPFLFIILNLLISADAQFARILSALPNMLSFRTDYLIRFLIVLFLAFSFFGYMQVLAQRNIQIFKQEGTIQPVTFDGIITLTVLVLLNIVYMLFIAVQFRYFFSGTLNDGFTYAEYARRGFFELLFVTLINLSVTTVSITYTKKLQGILKKTVNLALSVLVLSSGVLLISAFMRLMMYEEAYGFTFTRVLAHSFMIFLMVIFSYTLVKIWLENLSLFHFYFIAALIYYAGINVVNLDKIVVEQNVNRFELTGKIDIHYLNYMSATGVLGLIHLYEKDPDVPGLEALLRQRKAEKEYLKSGSWQSLNFTRQQAYEKLRALELRKEME